MKFHTITTFALTCSFAAAESETVTQVVSEYPGRKAKVEAENHPTIGGLPGEIRLLVGETMVWRESPGFGSALGSTVSWSAHGMKVAIELRGTKTSSRLHVMDVHNKKILEIPDLGAVARAMNGGRRGRYEFVSPTGWLDDDHLVVRVQGNVVDWLTDGFDHLNYTYLFTVHVPSQRIVSVTTTSKHDLNSKELREKGKKGAPD